MHESRKKIDRIKRCRFDSNTKFLHGFADDLQHWLQLCLVTDTQSIRWIANDFFLFIFWPYVLLRISCALFFHSQPYVINLFMSKLYFRFVLNKKKRFWNVWVRFRRAHVFVQHFFFQILIIFNANVDWNNVKMRPWKI